MHKNSTRLCGESPHEVQRARRTLEKPRVSSWPSYNTVSASYQNDCLRGGSKRNLAMRIPYGTARRRCRYCIRVYSRSRFFSREICNTNRFRNRTESTQLYPIRMQWYVTTASSSSSSRVEVNDYSNNNNNSIVYLLNRYNNNYTYMDRKEKKTTREALQHRVYHILYALPNHYYWYSLFPRLLKIVNRKNSARIWRSRTHTYMYT